MPDHHARPVPEIVLVLALGGAAYLSYAKWVAGVIAFFLIIVILSYRQTCFAYPSGGGAFAVSLSNFGVNAALTAASALLVDYVMTVAVSVVAGVVAITSAAPSLERHAVAISVGAVVLLMVANLRGLKESGRVFAIPTYAFVTLTYLLRVLAARGPASLRVCALLDKRARRIVDVPLSYVGFEVPDVFLVGYGLDLDERERGRGELLAVDDLEAVRDNPALLDLPTRPNDAWRPPRA